MRLWTSSVVVAVVLFCGAACAARPIQVAAPAATASWPQAYLDAIADAQDPRPSEIATNLVAIVRSNPLLIWRAFNDGDRVLVTTLVPDTSYFDTPDRHYKTQMRDVWVTAVPQMKNTCSQAGFDRGELSMRLRQVLGLTPTSTVTAFVDLWVLPSQLFRPAADNEIDDATAGVVMPPVTEAWYRMWFNDLRAEQYVQRTGHNAYPWTQLGYTYDWGSADHRGLSEFVIRRAQDVLVNRITPIQQYCSVAY